MNKTGGKIFFEIRELENKLDEIRAKKMVAKIGSTEYKELIEERGKIFVRLNILLDKEYIDTDSAHPSPLSIDIDKFKNYMNKEYGIEVYGE